MLPETSALRKMRDFLKLDRKSAAILIEKSSKQLEKIENGYVEVTPQLINHFVTNYGFSLKNYELLVAGKVEQVKNSFCPKKEKVLENNSLRRSYKKVIIKEARASQVLRRLQGLTQYKAITWAHEDKRLKRLWEKKKGKVSENKWKEMLYIGQLSEFITENSRLQVASNA